MLDRLRKMGGVAVRAGAVVVVVVGLKFAVHSLSWELLSLNPLLSGIVAADVFLMGFLLSGVLNDFKESERLPGELAASLELFSDEAAATYERSKSPVALEFLSFVQGLAESIRGWFYKKERTSALMGKLSELDRFFLSLEPLTQAGFILRLKQEQQSLRRTLIRIHTIRETSFVSSGYLIAELTTALLGIALILSKFDPLPESLFIVGVIMFLLSYLLLMIRDLDNPFGYYERRSAEEVSLKPLEDCIERIAARAERLTPGRTSERGTATPS